MAQISILEFQSEAQSGLPSGKVSFVIFALGAGIISAILSYGFLRTVCYEPLHRHQPGDLLKLGKGFFWRMVLFGIAAGFLGMVVLMPVLAVISKVFSSKAAIFELPESLMTLGVSIMLLILFKPITFVPAFIIGCDKGVMESFLSLKKFNIFQAKPVLVLFVVQVAANFLFSLFSVSKEQSAAGYYFMAAGPSALQQILNLMVAVGAVRFVLSLVRGDDIEKETKGERQGVSEQSKLEERFDG
jgi:hypothetical protein